MTGGWRESHATRHNNLYYSENISMIKIITRSIELPPLMRQLRSTHKFYAQKVDL